MLFVWVAREKEERWKLGDGRKRVAFAEGQCDMSPALPGLAVPTDFRQAARLLFLTHRERKGNGEPADE